MPGSTLGTTAGDRERILAAVGWQHDVRRRTILHDLLAEEVQRIYLYGYAATRNRASALEGARRILMSAARTIDVIPDGCPVSVWCFFLLEEERVKPAGQQDLWKVLLLAADESRRPAEETVDGSASRPRLAEHPEVRTLVELFDRYRSLPMDAELLTRSGWPAAHTDLRCFLDAQFGEAPCEDRGRGPGWRRFLPSGGWRFSRLLAAGIGLVVLVLVVVLLRSWEGLRGGPEAGPGGWNSQPDQQSTSVAVRSFALPQPPPAGPAPPEIAGSADQQEGRVTFRWLASSDAQSYRLFVLTAKLDTLTMISGLTLTSHGLSLAEIPGLHSPGSYLFRVDGLQRDKVVASTGFVPFDLH